MKKIVLLALVSVLFSTAVVVVFVRPLVAQETIYIRADGSVVGTDKIQRDGNIYTFTDNIYDEIVVERDNIIVDGAGYKLQGIRASNSKAVYLTGRKNVTIRNMEIIECFYGIYLNRSSSNRIIGNNMTNNQEGVTLSFSSDNTIYGNNIAMNYWGGIGLYDSSHSNNISRNNIKNSIKGIYGSSNNNTIFRNNITNIGTSAISIMSNNNISENIIADNNDGIDLGGSNTVSGNQILNNDGYGINLDMVYSSNNLISRNNIKNNENGIELWWSWTKDNIIRENNITNNWHGVSFEQCSNNNFYHNNFINNTQQVLIYRGPYTSPSINVWDNGYPSGGNYWSNYTGVDANGDGIGDTSHIIDDNNRDRYPLMNLRIPSEHEPITPTEVQVGVKAGDWIKCDYAITGWPAGTPYPEWLKVEFLSVEGTTATVRVTMHWSNGTEQNATVPVDVVAGGQAFGLSGFVIPANSKVGDSINMGGAGFTFTVTIDGETTRTYAGARRTVVYTSFSQYGTQLTCYWDKQTGVMVEGSTVSGSITATAKATETNMWEAAPSTIWMQWWLWTIVVVGIVASAGAVYFLKKRKQPTPTAQEAKVRMCDSCGQVKMTRRPKTLDGLEVWLCEDCYNRWHARV